MSERSDKIRAAMSEALKLAAPGEGIDWIRADAEAVKSCARKELTAKEAFAMWERYMESIWAIRLLHAKERIQHLRS